MTTLAAIGKKALLFLLGDKKGRKAVGYTVGIAVFLALLPLIIMMGLFHWLLGDGGAEMREQVRKEVESAYTESVEQYQEWEVLEDAVRRRGIPVLWCGNRVC